MVKSTAPITRILPKALLWSVLIHLLIAKFVALTFPLHPVRPRPFFVFLGGVLSPRDLLKLPEGTEKTTIKMRPERFSAIPRATPSDLLKNIHVQKPRWTPVQDMEKFQYQSTLDEFPAELEGQERKKEDSLEKLGISPQVPERPPLKLYSP